MIISIFNALIFGARTIINPAMAFGGPVLRKLASRSMLMIGAGVAMVVVPWLINNAGRRAVVADVTAQALELQNKDAAENLNLVKDQERIAATVRHAEIELKQTEKRVIDETFTDDKIANEWASQPLPDAVLKRLRAQ